MTRKSEIENVIIVIERDMKSDEFNQLKLVNLEVIK